jgi:P-type Ca2+ transporter type 2C
MAARHAIVRQLPAVEALGSVSGIATDKTGTITEGRMVVHRVWTPQGEAVISGSGYGLDGEVIRDEGVVRASDATDLSALLRAAALCTDARVQPPGPERPEGQVLGDPTEAALIVAAQKLGLRHIALVDAFPRVAEFPFDSVRKRMTTVHRQPSGYLVVCKGAPEFLLHADVILGEDLVLRAALTKAGEYAGAGLRVLAVAVKESESPPATAGVAESSLHLLGLVGMADPAKPSAPATIAAFRAAGITPILVTGDHPATVAAIATQVGIASEADQVVDGRSLGSGRSGSAALSTGRGTCHSRTEGGHHRCATRRRRDRRHDWRRRERRAGAPACRHRRGHGTARDGGCPAGCRPGARRR